MLCFGTLIVLHMPHRHTAQAPLVIDELQLIAPGGKCFHRLPQPRCPWVSVSTPARGLSAGLCSEPALEALGLPQGMLGVEVTRLPGAGTLAGLRVQGCWSPQLQGSGSGRVFF